MMSHSAVIVYALPKQCCYSMFSYVEELNLTVCGVNLSCLAQCTDVVKFSTSNYIVSVLATCRR